MVFGRLFGGSDENAKEGKRLFEEGMRHASNFECQKAIACYTRSIALSPNPAPYINRANLLAKRIRHREALADLSEAQRLDQRQGNEFSRVLATEIAKAEIISHNYYNGMREKLLIDYKETENEPYGRRGIAAKILCNSFGIPYPQWEYNTFDRTLIEFHFFNELDNISKFENKDIFPEAVEYLDVYSEKFIEKKVAECPDVEAYIKAEMTLHSFLCCYDPDDMNFIRRTMLYDIHEHLLALDFGDFYNTLSSESQGVIREAEGFTS